MSHEIRTPMNGVLAWRASRRYQAGFRTDALPKFCSSRARSLLRIINDIPGFRQGLSPGNWNWSMWISRLCRTTTARSRLMASRAQIQGIELASFIAPDVPHHREWRSRGCARYCSNLLPNAIKFTPGRVNVIAEVAAEDEAGCKLRIAVRDTGIGIPDDAKSRLPIGSAKSMVNHTALWRYGPPCDLQADHRAARRAYRRRPEPAERSGSTFWFTMKFQPAAGSGHRRSCRALHVACGKDHLSSTTTSDQPRNLRAPCRQPGRQLPERVGAGCCLKNLRRTARGAVRAGDHRPYDAEPVGRRVHAQRRRLTKVRVGHNPFCRPGFLRRSRPGCFRIGSVSPKTGLAATVRCMPSGEALGVARRGAQRP